MPSRKYKCKNVAGGCEFAFTKGIIEIEEGVEFECPSKLSGCGAEEITGKKDPAPAWPLWKKVAIPGAAVVILGVGVAVFMRPTPNPDLANQRLTEFFPGLKP